ncbi:MAG: lactate utilization protein [Synergistaceae bacterium]|nr:lactate utilization protein [Synergistaceae bacterium]
MRGEKCAVYQHWDPDLAPEMKAGRLKDEINADWFVTSSNAITYDGKMVNIDGVGNRVAGMAWATGKIVYVVSINKSEPNVESAIARSRNVATPPNALRINTYPPCTKIGYCVDCNSPDRACRAILIIEKVPVGREAHVVLVGENLGY